MSGVQVPPGPFTEINEDICVVIQEICELGIKAEFKLEEPIRVWWKMNRQEILKWYEKEFEDISKEITQKEHLSYSDFLRIRNFKLQNSSRENKDKIKRVTEEAFNLAEKDNIEEAISKLLEIHGVAIPIASTIFAMKYPDKYCIIDRIVISKLGKNEWLKRYISDTKVYREYLLLMRETAKGKGMNLRDFERSLFENNSV